MLLASALGNYPTPLLGYGGSGILGYLLCLAALPRQGLGRASSVEAEREEARPPGESRFAAI